jgi:hypothetical protein
MSADQQPAQYVLVKFHKSQYNGDNAEHSTISLEGFAVTLKSDWQKHLQDIERFSWPQSKFIFGMTDPVRWNSKEDYLSCFETVDISPSDYEVFKKR